jgi:ribosomal subunit interface protein
MSLRVSGKNIELGEALHERINARIGHALSKYFDGGYSGHVTVTRDGVGFRTECAIHLDTKTMLEAEGAAPDAYASADQAAERLEKQLRRYHRRLKDHRAQRVKPAAPAT